MTDNESGTSVHSNSLSILQSFVSFIQLESWIQSIHELSNKLGGYYILNFLFDYVPIYYCVFSLVIKVYRRSMQRKSVYTKQMDKIEKELSVAKSKLEECNTTMKERLKELDSETDRFIRLKAIVRAMIDANPHLLNYINDFIIFEPNNSGSSDPVINKEVLVKLHRAHMSKLSEVNSCHSYCNRPSRTNSNSSESYHEDRVNGLERLAEVASDIKQHLDFWHHTLNCVVNMQNNEFFNGIKMSSSVERIFRAPLGSEDPSSSELSSARQNALQADEVRLSWPAQQLYGSGDGALDNIDKYNNDLTSRENTLNQPKADILILENVLDTLLEETKSQMEVYGKDEFSDEYY